MRWTPNFLIRLTLVTLCFGKLPYQGYAQHVNSRANSWTSVIIPSESDPPVRTDIRVLELLRTRFPIAVARGRFDSDDGPTSVCVSARRSASTGIQSKANTDGIPYCTMIGVYVDGVRISQAGAYMEAMRALDFQSLEILSATEATTRYGLSSGGTDALVLWSRGRGPYTKRK